MLNIYKPYKLSTIVAHGELIWNGTDPYTFVFPRKRRPTDYLILFMKMQVIHLSGRLIFGVILIPHMVLMWFLIVLLESLCFLVELDYYN
jgi:hypothetical protein